MPGLGGPLIEARVSYGALVGRGVLGSLRFDAKGRREHCAGLQHGPDRTDALLGLRECGRYDGGIDRTADVVVECDGGEDRRVLCTTVAARRNGEASDRLTSAPKQSHHGPAGAGGKTAEKELERARADAGLGRVERIVGCERVRAGRYDEAHAFLMDGVGAEFHVTSLCEW